MGRCEEKPLQRSRHGPARCACQSLTARRLRQVLHCIMSGYSEKEIGKRLGISRNTVHVYVGSIYRHFNVNSRGELLARILSMLAKSTRCKDRVPVTGLWAIEPAGNRPNGSTNPPTKV